MLFNLFAGFVIGIGLIMPGVSGGVIAVILNIYDEMVYSLNNLFKKPKQSIKFLIPIVLGAGIGAFLVGKIIKFLLFEKGYFQVYFLFIGLILGSIPKLLKNIKEKDKPNYLLIIISFSFSLLLFIFGKDLVSLSINNIEGSQSFIYLLLTGFIFSMGKIVPGISSSFMLMLVGTYEYFIDLITDPIGMISKNYFEFIFLMIGIIIGIVVFVKLMNYLLKKHYANTYSLIIGFVAGSVFAIFPGISIDFNGLISIIILIISFIFSYIFSMKNK